MIFGYKELRDIPEFNTFKRIVPLKENFLESKYHIYRKDNTDCLLAVYNSMFRQIDLKKIELHNHILNNKVPTNDLISYGVCNNNRKFYILFSWINGTDLSKIVLEFSDNKQYELGLNAGQLLKRIHDIKSTNTYVNNDDRIKYLLNKYENNVLYFEKYPFLETFLSLIKTAHGNNCYRFSFLHGDYSIYNMVFSDGKIAVIDWVYGSFGDPWEDFVRNIVNAKISEPFAIGQIDGYFNYKIPEGFWRTLYFYTLIHQVELLDLEVIDEKSKEAFIISKHTLFMKEYCDVNTCIPKYYKNRRGYNEFR